MEKTYNFKITETLQRLVTVKAANAKEARKKIDDLYMTENIVLDASDFQEVKIARYNGIVL